MREDELISILDLFFDKFDSKVFDLDKDEKEMLEKLFPWSIDEERDVRDFLG